MTFDANVWAAIGQCVSAVAAVLGLWYIGRQLQIGRRTSDLQALQTFLKDVKEHERALLHSAGDDKNSAFVEFLNFLEVYALAFNGKLFSGVSCEVVEQKLVDSLTIIAALPEWHPKLEMAITSQTTFLGLKRFMENHRRQLDAALEVQQQMAS